MPGVSVMRRRARAVRRRNRFARRADAEQDTHERVRSLDVQRRLSPRSRQVHAELFQERDEVSRPADRHRRRAEEILEDEIPPDDPGDELTHRGVAVRVRAASDRNHRGEFGVAEAGE